MSKYNICRVSLSKHIRNIIISKGFNNICLLLNFIFSDKVIIHTFYLLIFRQRTFTLTNSFILFTIIVFWAQLFIYFSIFDLTRVAQETFTINLSAMFSFSLLTVWKSNIHFLQINYTMQSYKFFLLNIIVTHVWSKLIIGTLW